MSFPTFLDVDLVILLLFHYKFISKKYSVIWAVSDPTVLSVQKSPHMNSEVPLAVELNLVSVVPLCMCPMRVYLKPVSTVAPLWTSYCILIDH